MQRIRFVLMQLMMFVFCTVAIAQTLQFEASARRACQGIIQALTAPGLVAAVGFVMFVAGVWGWYLQQNGAISRTLYAVVGSVVVLSVVAIGGWFALAC